MHVRVSFQAIIIGLLIGQSGWVSATVANPILPDMMILLECIDDLDSDNECDERTDQCVDQDDDLLCMDDELANGLDPNDPADALLDPDSDGLTNLAEINTYGTNINDSDTDNDGIDDGKEVTYGFDPNDGTDAAGDSDLDTLTNLDEINMHNTDPNKEDTDDDGIPDRVELEVGMNPLVPDDLGGITPQDKHRVHIMNRLTFGPTPDLNTEIEAMGVTAWIADQLQPESIPIKGSFTETMNPAQYHRDNQLLRHKYQTESMAGIRPMESEKHIQALMGVFWDNHFNTYQDSHRYGPRELYEEDTFYENALGNFKDMLELSAKSYTMSIYLNGDKNKKGAPNENYAREVMELHTMGVGGGYTATDIAELARIFTGWGHDNDPVNTSRYDFYDDEDDNSSTPETVRSSWVKLKRFLFRDYNHDDTGNKLFLGHMISSIVGSAGVSEGEDALVILAEHPSTASFICTKLAKRFVSDSPSLVTINNCKATFTAALDSSDQVAQVLTTLFNSSEFNEVGTQRNKSKDIQEYLLGVGRLLGWEGERGWRSTSSSQPCKPGKQRTVGCRVERAGQGFFRQAPPTGWPEDSAEWISTGNVLGLMEHTNEMVFGQDAMNLVTYFNALGLSDVDDIMRYVFLMMLGGEYDAIDINLAYSILRPNHTPFIIGNSEQALRMLIAQFSLLPQYHLQ